MAGSTEDALAAAQRRIAELEEALTDSEQESAAAAEIINEQDARIEELKAELEAADLLLDLEVVTRRQLERRLAALEATEAVDDPCPVAVPVQKVSAPPQELGYPRGYRPNPTVEAMLTQFRSRDKK